MKRSVVANPKRRYRPLLGVAILLALGCFPGRASAQVGMDTIPSMQYTGSFSQFYDGDYRSALANYFDTQRNAIKSPFSRWIDSICYHAMAGECLYNLGQIPQAVDQYTAALNLYVQFSDWMMRCQFPPVIGPSPSALPVTPWGVSRRGVTIGNVPDEILMGQGQINNNSALVTGGVVQQPIMFPVRVAEIVRCTALAIRRRAELLGPISKHDPLNAKLVSVLTGRPGPPGSWSEAWIDLELGVAYAAMENWPQAMTCLERSLIINGQFDHPLTCVALFEMGKIAQTMGDAISAGRYFEEATYSAAIFGDITLLEEAFRYGQLNHVVTSQKGVYPPLLTAVAWAKGKGYRQLNASLSILAAECFATQGDTQRAVLMLNDARTEMFRNDLSISVLGARLNHITAITCFQTGAVAEGDTAMTAAMTFEHLGSHWLFQLHRADQLFLDGDVTERVGLALYETLLRDPAPTDWASDPLETLAVLTAPHAAPYEHWFDAVMKHSKENYEAAIEIADRARRHDFFSSLPYGGRLLALRWLLEGPHELISDDAKLQRQELLSRYSDYDALSKKARKLRSELTAQPLAPEGAEDRRKQTELLTELANTGRNQELLLRQIAVRREAADFVFPPLRTTADIQKRLPPGQVLLIFFNTTSSLHAFVFGREKYANWRVSNAGSMQKSVAGLLRDMGHFEQNHQLSLTELSKETWKKSASKILDAISERHLDLTAKFDELIIVPDGPLWYLPFEALPVGKKGEPLISRVRVRYSPTAGLAIPYSRAEKPERTIGVINGKMFPRDDESISQRAFEQIGHSVPGAVAWPKTWPAPSSVYRLLFDELIVLDDLQPPNDEAPYSWSPAPADRTNVGGSLDAWMHLPWGGPEQLILPGFHTAAEASLKRGGNGQELFLALCGLMSSGARTVLISRWRVGGQSSFDLVREFAQELPHASAAEAWQRSVMLATSHPLEPEMEPRLKAPNAEATIPNADNPFFWAGYMLVDSGKLAANEEPPPPPVLNFQKKPAVAPAGAAPGKAVPAGKLPPLPGPRAQMPAAAMAPPANGLGPGGQANGNPAAGGGLGTGRPTALPGLKDPNAAADAAPPAGEAGMAADEPPPAGKPSSKTGAKSKGGSAEPRKKALPKALPKMPKLPDE